VRCTVTLRSHLTQIRMARAIAEALDADGLSQSEFARMAGVSAKHVNQVLGGKAGAQPATLDYWAYLLGREWHFELRVARPDSESSP
jgi:transcriptional regulator with XRE-family HTH domain